MCQISQHPTLDEVQISESTPLFIWISKVQLQTHPIFQHFFHNTQCEQIHATSEQIQAINPSHQSKPSIQATC